LGIDEFALRKGHRYDTILCDLEARDVLEICDGRKKEEVVQLLERLSDPDAVKAVSMDMSASFRPAVQTALPKAQIVVDHFHVIQLPNQQVHIPYNMLKTTTSSRPKLEIFYRKQL
jgi:transposase